MKNKIKSITKKQWCIAAGVLSTIIVSVITVHIITNNMDSNTALSMQDIDVTEEEMQEYRERIGTDMDIKKSYLILFEDEERCRSFIAEHGNDENPCEAGIGIIPFMENGYYNIVGKQLLEDEFDKLGDGEYSKEPIMYSGLYCYLKRIGIDSPVSDERMLKQLIQHEKYQEMRKAEE